MNHSEVQKSRVIAYSLGAALIFVAGMFVLVVVRGVPESRIPAGIVLGLVFLLLGFLFWKMRSLVIHLDKDTLSFGFPPFVCRVPVREISSVRIVDLGMLNSGGWGIRWTIGGRWNYVAALGPGVEIDWGSKKRGFSTSEPEKLKAALTALCPGKVTDKRKGLS